MSVNLLSNCLRTVSTLNQKMRKKETFFFGRSRTKVVSSNGLEIPSACAVSPDSSLLADSLALAEGFVRCGEFEVRGVSGLSAEEIPFVGTLRGVAFGGMAKQSEKKVERNPS